MATEQQTTFPSILDVFSMDDKQEQKACLKKIFLKAGLPDGILTEADLDEMVSNTTEDSKGN